MAERTLVGVLSDTHGVLKPEAELALSGCDRIIHAGDVGRPEVLEALRGIAPVTAVYGNMDSEDLRHDLARVAAVTVDGVDFVVAHEKRDLPVVETEPKQQAVMVFGHTHVPVVERGSSVLWLNPGSASRGRAGFSRSVAVVVIESGRPTARIVAL